VKFFNLFERISNESNSANFKDHVARGAAERGVYRLQSFWLRSGRARYERLGCDKRHRDGWRHICRHFRFGSVRSIRHRKLDDNAWLQQFGHESVRFDLRLRYGNRLDQRHDGWNQFFYAKLQFFHPELQLFFQWHNEINAQRHKHAAAYALSKIPTIPGARHAWTG
jgi:hypothetical protein